MEPTPAHLSALAAIVDTGTFDAAARALHVTPSAISQRIRSLESAAGQVLVTRSTPCRPTAAGEALLRLARQSRLLWDEARAELAESPEHVIDLPVAVNADSLATWFGPLLRELASWPRTALRLHVEDEGYSTRLLRSGEVLGAVTSEPTTIQGCVVERLGTLRYRPAATPEFVERWRRGRGVDWAAMPLVVFNEKDRLQHRVLADRGVDAPPPVVHRVPTSADYLAAVVAGLGWGAIPEPQLTPAIDDGSLVPLPGARWLAVPLSWQRWRLDSPSLDRLTAAVHAAAAPALSTR